MLPIITQAHPTKISKEIAKVKNAVSKNHLKLSSSLEKLSTLTKELNMMEDSYNQSIEKIAKYTIEIDKAESEISELLDEKEKAKKMAKEKGVTLGLSPKYQRKKSGISSKVKIIESSKKVLSEKLLDQERMLEENRLKCVALQFDIDSFTKQYKESLEHATDPHDTLNKPKGPKCFDESMKAFKELENIGSTDGMQKDLLRNTANRYFSTKEDIMEEMDLKKLHTIFLDHIKTGETYHEAMSLTEQEYQKKFASAKKEASSPEAESEQISQTSALVEQEAITDSIQTNEPEPLKHTGTEREAQTTFKEKVSQYLEDTINNTPENHKDKLQVISERMLGPRTWQEVSESTEKKDWVHLDIALATFHELSKQIWENPKIDPKGHFELYKNIFESINKAFLVQKSQADQATSASNSKVNETSVTLTKTPSSPHSADGSNSVAPAHSSHNTAVNPREKKGARKRVDINSSASDETTSDRPKVAPPPPPPPRKQQSDTVDVQKVKTSQTNTPLGTSTSNNGATEDITKAPNDQLTRESDDIKSFTKQNESE